MHYSASSLTCAQTGFSMLKSLLLFKRRDFEPCQESRFQNLQQAYTHSFGIQGSFNQLCDTCKGAVLFCNNSNFYIECEQVEAKSIVIQPLLFPMKWFFSKCTKTTEHQVLIESSLFYEISLIPSELWFYFSPPLPCFPSILTSATDVRSISLYVIYLLFSLYA